MLPHYLSSRRLLAPLASAVILFIVAAGCDTTDSNSDDTASLTLNLAVQNSGQTSNNVAQSSHLTITEAKILIREIELETDLEDDGLADDSLEFETGPLAVNLNLDGSVNPISVNEVPAGRYDEIEFEIHKPEDNETPPDPDFKIGTSGDERFSVIVHGTYNGQDFLYRSTESMEQEIELNTPLVIEDGQGNINVTLSVDLGQWFVDENGNDLDPTLEDNRDKIDDSIKRSFKAFKDDDEDGNEE